MKQVFDSIAWIFHPLMKLSGKPKLFAKKIITIAKPKKEDKILDIGGGTGLIAEILLKQCNNVTVLDPSKEMLKKITSKKIKKIRATLQKNPLKKNSFDIITCVDSFHHLTNKYKKKDHEKIIDQSIKEILRILKKKGTLLMIEFDPTSFQGKMIKFFENNLLKMNSRFYPPDTLRTLFQKHNCTTTIHRINTRTYIAKIKKN
ncbi:hypothetical protein CMO92_02315 [Candidatus Woesearchaeota archaeon]|nr:hypothetical protein [Candidatus Woesearchaeota archaeon]|tara:strand:- start:296 stop:904 length:609 start_codon:yes stop_codon:yes gene_type:complete